MDCQICATPFNKSIRAKITCFACDFSACKECTRTFLTTSLSLPKCMNCNVPFPTRFQIRNLNRSWVLSTYKETETKILTGIELGKLPETQPYVEAEREKGRIKQQNTQYTIELKALKAKAVLLSNAIRANQFLLRGEQIPIYLQDNEFVDGRSILVDTRKKFIMSCPLDCRGFLSTAYKCGTCQKTVCSDCLCLKQAGHVCIEENRLTAELIKKESKPCPKCGARICKIDGCDQMYCVSQDSGIHCNTAFSWKTGMIETGPIHNPEYYALMRKEGIQLRNAGDIQCGGMPDIRRLVRAVDGMRQACSNVVPLTLELTETVNELTAFRSKLLKIHRNVSEMVQYTTHQNRARINAHESAKRDLRVRYMLKTINKTIFSEHIYRMAHDHQKSVDIHNVAELISISGIETFQQIMNELPPYYEHEWSELAKQPGVIRDVIKNVIEKMTQLSRVRDYCNDQLKDVSITYHCIVNIMDDVFTPSPVKYNMNGEKVKRAVVA